ncbi:MAG: hypothetical protein ACRC0X_03320 [Brevinema sp.]
MSELKSCGKKFHRHVLISVGERKNKQEIISMIVSKLKLIKEEIPAVIDISVHHHQFQDNYATAVVADIAMVIVLEDVEAYENHPYYLEVSDFIVNHSALRMRVEYMD